jgi:hypothetical protein
MVYGSIANSSLVIAVRHTVQQNYEPLLLLITFNKEA